MSSQLVASAISRSTSKLATFSRASLGFVPQPLVPFKTSQTFSLFQKYHYSSGSGSALRPNIIQYGKRMETNVARLYARRMIELAAMSAATLASKTSLEGVMMSSSSSSSSKPTEWTTIDLAKQRKEFGESISSLGKTRISRVWAAGSRIANLVLLASPLAILTPMAYLAGPKSKTSDFAWDYAVWSVEMAGPTFIKLIQWATTRNDLFPPEFVEHFTQLQDNTRGHSWQHTAKTFEKDLGADYNDWFEFESGDGKFRRNDKIKPIGSGCVAQVYKAKLKKDTTLLPAGSEVAIKVTHPHILHKVCVDFYIMNKLTAAFEALPYLNLDYLSMRDSVAQFRDIMLPQLDLRVEARNLQRFRRDFSDDPYVEFPMPITDFTTKDVLVESFVHGEPILNYCIQGLKSRKDREYLAEFGLRTVMKMIFEYDFVHGDLHPGNIIINRNMDVKGHPLCMNLIDCGLVVELGEQDHVNLVKVLGALIKRDGNESAKLMIDTAKKCQANELDVKLFCKGIQKICDDDVDQNFLESVGDYLADICYLACKHKVKLEPSFINAALACEIMEGIASKLYPTLAVQHIAFPMVVKAEVMHGLKEMKKKW
uniref:Protein kinase domain-containing protein n=1 Tax=Chaetoceros debilis TaxID=122233 RepID=A0A7S3VDU5_9STRA|mmetsp:Transcript_20965/g.31845  ORF Transcript_20965/g.31845 Transcript_20965/m.31845 type:complete len:597 (+) Transcript_20965:234-2024(+)